MVDAAIAAMQVEMPDWVPQEGATEIVLIESLSLLIGQQVYALNQLPRVVLDGLIALRGIVRHPAVVASGSLLITLAASTVGTRIIPLGARFRVPLPDGGTVDLTGTEALSINPADGLTGVLAVHTVAAGAAANGIGPPTSVQVVDAMAWIESAVVFSALAGGGERESDTAFYARASVVMQRDHGALVVDSQFAMAALDVPGVGRAGAWGLWDGTGVAGSDVGHVTVAIAGPDGSNVVAGIKTTVLNLLTAAAVAGLTIHVIDFVKVTMSITLTYVLAAGYLAADVTAAIEVELLAWLSPASWPLGQELTTANQVILRIGRVPGVANVTALAGWSTVSGPATLPSLTAVAITAT